MLQYWHLRLWFFVVRTGICALYSFVLELRTSCRNPSVERSRVSVLPVVKIRLFMEEY